MSTGLPSIASKSMACLRRTSVPNGFFKPGIRACGIATPPPVPVDPRPSRLSNSKEIRPASKLRAEAARAANSCSKRVLSAPRSLIKASVGKRNSLISMATAPALYIVVTANNSSDGVEDHGLVCCAQTIYNSCFRQDVLRTFRIRLDFLPELPNVYTKILRVGEVTPQFS